MNIEMNIEMQLIPIKANETFVKDLMIGTLIAIEEPVSGFRPDQVFTCATVTKINSRMITVITAGKPLERKFDRYSLREWGYSKSWSAASIAVIERSPDQATYSLAENMRLGVRVFMSWEIAKTSMNGKLSVVAVRRQDAIGRIREVKWEDVDLGTLEAVLRVLDLKR